MLVEVTVHGIMGSHSQISSVSVYHWRLLGSVTVNLAVDTVTNSKIISSYNKRCVLALFNCADFRDSSYKYCAIHARIDQH